jgi:hypothetical protein
MYTFQGDIMKVVAGVAVIGAVATRAVDHANKKRNAFVAHLLRTLVLALVCAGVIVVFGTQIGTVAHTVELLKSGFSDLEGFPMKAGKAPF